MVKASVFIYDKPFDGFPKEEDIKLIQEDLKPLKDGEFLAEAAYLSVDPYMRGYAPAFKLGTTFIGGQIALNTAYFGLLEICHPKPGETVVVTGAAGAVGSHVGQIAKIKGCKVIGIAGSDDKGKWLTDELNFDHFINYKTANVKKTLKQIATHGVDCYFDNVGGEVSSIIINQMNRFGRISVCGAISAYNERYPKAGAIQGSFAMKQLKMEGFIVDRWLNRWTEGIDQNINWIQEGKIKYRETVTDGFENMFQAFTDMLKGVNYGKAIVRVKSMIK